MHCFDRGTTCPAVLTVGAAAGSGCRRLVRAGLAAAAASLLAVVGIGFAAGAAQASTFPGTNGVIAYSAEVATEPTNSGSAFEIVSKTSGAATEYRCTVNQLTDVQPKFSQDGKIVAWLQNGNVVTTKLSVSTAAPTTWDCPYNLDGSPRPGATVSATNPVTSNALDSWLGGFSRWEYPAGTADDTHALRKAWLFFSRRVAAVGTTPANFEVFKAQVDKDGVVVAGTLANVTNHAVDPLPASQTTGITDSQPTLCTEGATRKLAWTSTRTGGSGLADIWEQTLDASYNPTGAAVPRSENTAKEESAAAYKPTASDNCATIAFQTDRTTALTPGSPRNLDIFRTDGGGVKRLTWNDPTLAANGGLLDLTGYDVTPQWSPDASRICFHSGRAKTPPEWQLTAGLAVLGQWEVYTVDAVDGEGPGGSAAQRETTREYNDERCGWQEAP